MGKDMIKQNITFCQTKSFVDPSQVSLTCETLVKDTAWRDSSSSSHVLYTWLFLREASREIVVSQLQNPLVHSLKLESSLISHTHPLQLNSHNNKTSLSSKTSRTQGTYTEQVKCDQDIKRDI